MARQIPVHKAALAYGQSFALALPGQSGQALLRGYSPLESIAIYGDEADDDFPMFFLRETKNPNGTTLLRLIDEQASYFVGGHTGQQDLTFIEERPHGLGVCPVVRYANDIDLMGRTPGEVEPLIPIARRINKTDFDRLLAQHFNSWKVRTATGLDDSRTEKEKAEQKQTLSHSDILIGADGVQFGTLEQTQLEGFIKSKDSEIEAFAAISQTPPTTYGKIVNVSAEGLAAARASLYAKRDERQTTFGAAHANLLRLAARIEHRTEDAQDYTITVGWADTDIRTMAEAVDALGKAATMLGIPPELLWERIPGVDFTTAESWLAWAQANPSSQMIEAQAALAQAATVATHLAA